MRISDWSSDVCSSDLPSSSSIHASYSNEHWSSMRHRLCLCTIIPVVIRPQAKRISRLRKDSRLSPATWESSRSEEHTSELQSLMRISYAVFCSQQKNTQKHTHPYPNMPLRPTQLLHCH